MSDPESILKQLDPEQLAAKLRELDGDRRAVMILLRAARAREKRGDRRMSTDSSEGKSCRSR
jgi:hypothetical protein